MIVVSDTSPLNYLVLIGRQEILPILFRRVLTTPAVLAELRHARSPDVVRRWIDSPPAWLEERRPTSLHPSIHLGAGETEAISLAAELHADALLMDERKGTAAARGLGLFVTGTLGVLMIAAERGLIDLDAALGDLRSTNFRFPPTPR